MLGEAELADPIWKSHHSIYQIWNNSYKETTALKNPDNVIRMKFPMPNNQLLPFTSSFPNKKQIIHL